MCAVELRCVLTGEDRFLFIVSMSYGMYWTFVTCSLVCLVDQFCSAIVDFSLLIIVLNIHVDVHSLHTELCSLYGKMD